MDVLRASEYPIKFNTYLNQTRDIIRKLRKIIQKIYK